MDDYNYDTLTKVPLDDEKQTIKRSYNLGGGIVLLTTVAVQILYTIITAIILVVYSMQSGFSEAAYNELVTTLSGIGFTTLILNLIVAVAVDLPMILIGFKSIKVNIGSLFNKNFNWKTVGKITVVALGIQVVGSYIAAIITFIFQGFGVTLTTPDFSASPDIATNIMLFVYTCIAAPILEELLFRGFLLKAFSKVSIRFGIIASAVFFGLFHLNFPQFIAATLMGIVFGYAAYKTGSIIPAIIIHASLNLMGFIQQMLVFNLNEVAAALIILGINVLVVMGGIIIVVLNRKKINIPKDNEIQKARTAPLFFTSVPVILYVLCTVGIMVFIAVTSSAV